MKTPVQAMCWELWRTSRMGMLMRIGGLCSSVLLLFSLRRPSADSPESYVICGITILLLTSVAVASQTWILQFDREQSGFSFRSNFVRPISTGQLVAVPVLFTVLTSAVCYLTPALLARWLTGIPLPLLGPVAVISCAVVCFTAASWCPTTIPAKVAAFVTLATAAVMLMVLTHRDHPEPWLMAIGRPEHFDFRWPHFAVMLLTGGLALAATVVSVERQRHGDRWLPERWFGVSTTDGPGEVQHGSELSKSVFRSESPRAFANPFAAQCWYEFRRFGRRTVLIGALLPIFVAIFVIVMPSLKAGWQGTPTVWLIAILVCPLVYQIIGIDGAVGLKPTRGVLLFPVFDATRPLSGDQLIGIKLIVAAVCSLVGWLCMLLAAGLHTLLSGEADVWMRSAGTAVELMKNAPLWWWAAALSGMALFLISTTSLLLAVWLWLPLHPMISGSCSLIAVVHVLLVCWDARRGWVLWPLWQAYGYLIPALIIGGCLLALQKGSAVGMFRTPLFATGATVWSIYVVTAVAAMLKLLSRAAVEIPGQAFAAAIAMMLAPLAAVAIAPLVLAQHRHR